MTAKIIFFSPDHRVVHGFAAMSFAEARAAFAAAGFVHTSFIKRREDMDNAEGDYIAKQLDADDFVAFEWHAGSKPTDYAKKMVAVGDADWLKL